MSKRNKPEMSVTESESSNPGVLKKRLWVVVAIAVLSLGVLGAGLKYLEEDAKKQNALKAADRSALSSVNPFVVSPPPSPTPQLSKELIYAGSRLLNVIDAGAQEAPPADLAFWRPSNGVWSVMGGAGGSQPVVQAWGLPDDKPVPGDYDGDGKTDFSVFRPSTGEWYIFRSSDSAWSVWQWGLTTDVRVPADYDGDGKTDRAVWRQDGTWYVVHSSTESAVYHSYGMSGDIPAPADYDGDGKSDIGVWRTSNATFYSQNSSDNAFQTVSLGSGTEPVSADYDGDGKADYAVRSSANWIVRKSSNLQTETITWQQSGDVPVQNDYDGDGKVDIATWRPSNGNWLIRQSSLLGQPDELRQVQWGQSGDIPVPAFYRR